MEKSYTMAIFEMVERDENPGEMVNAGMRKHLDKVTEAVTGYVAADACFVIAALEITAENLRKLHKDDVLQLAMVEVLEKSGTAEFQSIAIPVQVEGA